MMKRMNDITRRVSRMTAPLLCLGSMMGLFACSSEYETVAPPESEMTSLRINVYSPADATRAAEEKVADESAGEGLIWDVRVYAFMTGSEGDDRAIGYAIDESVGGQSEEYTCTMQLPKATVNRELDFYLMANVAQLGDAVSTLGYYPTRDAVESAAFDAFGTTTIVGAVPTEKGLPASQILKAQKPIMSLKDDNELKGIKLTRAVSKFRFFFAQRAGMSGAEITKIEIDKDVLPEKQFIMPYAADGTVNVDHYNVADGKSSALYTYNVGLSGTGINSVAEPSALVRESTEAFSDYLTRLSASATPYGLTYIRESDKPLTGKIYYKVGSQEGNAAFEIRTADGVDEHTAACFPRNHYAVVYGYFNGNRLEVVPTVLPWVREDAYQYDMNIDYGSTKLSFENIYYRYDAVNLDWWSDSYTAVSDGVDTRAQIPNPDDADTEHPTIDNPDKGRPLYSPMMTIGVNLGAQMQKVELVSSNPAFKFITLTTTGGANTYSEPQVKLTFSTSTTEDLKYFVVPEAGTADGATAEVTLVATFNDGTTIRLPYNADVMPGSSAHTTIQYRYISNADYQNAASNPNIRIEAAK